MSPVLSIVTITYQDPEGLARTLESLRSLAGASFSWEHVIVDSSPEKNRAVIADFQGSRPLRQLVQPPAGIYVAMNMGWREAKGRYVWFLNGGDQALSLPCLEEAMAAFTENGTLELVMASARLERDGQYLHTQPPRTGEWALIGINRLCQQQVIYGRGLLERLGGFSEEYRLAADYEFHLRAVASGAPTAKIHGTLVAYDMGGRSANVEAVFQEFQQVHQRLAEQNLLNRPALHSLVRTVERFRILTLRKLSRGKLGRGLREIWHGWKRWKNRS